MGRKGKKKLKLCSKKEANQHKHQQKIELHKQWDKKYTNIADFRNATNEWIDPENKKKANVGLTQKNTFCFWVYSRSRPSQ